MMNSIQKLIKQIEAEKFNATENIRQCSKDKNHYTAGYWRGVEKALNFIIPELKLLLKSAHESNHKDFAHCANTVLGDSAASVENSTGKEPAGERLSETVDVMQNEQTKEVCPKCGNEGWIYLMNGGVKKCNKC